MLLYKGNRFYETYCIHGRCPFSHIPNEQWFQLNFLNTNVELHISPNSYFTQPGVMSKTEVDSLSVQAIASSHTFIDVSWSSLFLVDVDIRMAR